MILSPTAANRVLIQCSEAGNRLPGIEDRAACTGHGIDILPGRGRDAAHSLKHIEDDALTAQHDSCVMAHDGNLLSRANADAVENFAVSDDFRMGTHRAVKR